MKTSRQVKATAAFTIASLVTQGLNLLATPIYVRYMSTEEIGAVSNFNSWVTILGIIINMMLYGNSYIVAMNEYPDKRDRYSSVALFTSTISTIIAFTIYLIFRRSLGSLFGMNMLLVVIMFLGFLFHPATNMWMTRQRYEYKYIAVLIISSLQAVLSTSISIIAVINTDKIGISAPEARIVFTNGVTILIGFFFALYIMIKGRCFFDRTFGRFILKVNTPTIIQALSKTVLDISDRLMIASIIGQTALGIYGTIYSFASLLSILWNALNTAVLPNMFECMNNIDNEKAHLKKIIMHIVLIYSIISICFTLIIPELLTIFTSGDYVKEVNLAAPIICGCYLTSLYSIMGNVLLYNKKTSSIAWATGIAAIMNVGLNAIFIKIFGYYAAAYTTLIGFIILSFCLYISIRRLQNDTKDFCDMRVLLPMYVVTMILIFICPIIFSILWVRYAIIAMMMFFTACIFIRKKAKKLRS